MSFNLRASKHILTLPSFFRHENEISSFYATFGADCIANTTLSICYKIENMSENVFTDFSKDTCFRNNKIFCCSQRCCYTINKIHFIASYYWFKDSCSSVLSNICLNFHVIHWINILELNSTGIFDSIAFFNQCTYNFQILVSVCTIIFHTSFNQIFWRGMGSL